MEVEKEEGKTFVLDAFGFDYKGGGWVSAATILGKFPFSCFAFFICSLEKVNFLTRKH